MVAAAALGALLLGLAIAPAAVGAPTDPLQPDRGEDEDPGPAVSSVLAEQGAALDGAVPAEGLGPEFYRDLAEVAATYNEEADRHDLGVLGAHLGGERVDLHVVRADGVAEIVSFRTTEDVRVRDLRAGPHPDATLRVTVPEETARALVERDRPGAAAEDAFLRGAIDVEGLTTYDALKWGAFGAALDLVVALAGLLAWLLSLFP